MFLISKCTQNQQKQTRFQTLCSGNALALAGTLERCTLMQLISSSGSGEAAKKRNCLGEKFFYAKLESKFRECRGEFLFLFSTRGDKSPEKIAC